MCCQISSLQSDCGPYVHRWESRTDEGYGGIRRNELSRRQYYRDCAVLGREFCGQRFLGVRIVLVLGSWDAVKGSQNPEVKIRTLPQKTRKGWGTLSFISIFFLTLFSGLACRSSF